MDTTLTLLILSIAFISIFLLKHLASFLNWIYTLFLRPPKNLLGYGSWALVTGPTDGIGRAIAFELARKGLSLVLVGRNPDKLKSVADDLLLQFPGIRIETIVVDLADGDGLGPEGVRRVRDVAERREVGVLVNNAGLANTTPAWFHETGEEMVRGMVKVNVVGLTMVTYAVLPKMLERGRGAIVNVGSGSTLIPSHPLFATYVGTKGYVEAFSRTLHVEYKKNGIDVQCQLPLYVRTKMVPYVKGKRLDAPSAESFARAAVRQIGYEAVCVPYWSHSVQLWLAGFAPDFVLNAWRLRASMQNRKALK